MSKLRTESLASTSPNRVVSPVEPTACLKEDTITTEHYHIPRMCEDEERMEVRELRELGESGHRRFLEGKVAEEVLLESLWRRRGLV